MSDFATIGGSFVREHLREPLTLALLVVIPIFFILIFASVLGEFAKALGGSLAGNATAAISAGWAAAFLCGALAYFQVSSSRGADRRLAYAGFGAWRVALARLAASAVLGVLVSVIAFVTLWLRSGVEHPVHAAAAIFAFALIYIGIGAFIGALVPSQLEGSLLVVLVFSVDAFSGPTMTSSGGLLSYGPTRAASELLIAAGSGQTSASSSWYEVLAAVAVAILIALGAFLMSARSRL